MSNDNVENRLSKIEEKLSYVLQLLLEQEDLNKRILQLPQVQQLLQVEDECCEGECDGCHVCSPR